MNSKSVVLLCHTVVNNKGISEMEIRAGHWPICWFVGTKLVPGLFGILCLDKSYRELIAETLIEKCPS